jgi:hypothetical protein
VLRRFLDAKPGSRPHKTMGGQLRDVIIKGVHRRFKDDPVFDLRWPPGLFIPAGANPRDYWPTDAPPAANRFALAWTNGIGFSTASVADGSLHAAAFSPTAKGAIDGKAEAGVGVVYAPKHTLVRLQVEPELAFTGLHQWDVFPPAVVWVRTRVVGSVLVGAFQRNPATGGWDHLLNYTWRRHVIFDEANQGSGKYALTSVPLALSGGAAGHSLIAEAGRTYLLAVVAQVALRVETLDSQGNPVNVRSGRFDTFGSVTGVVRQIWVEQQVLVD